MSDEMVDCPACDGDGVYVERILQGYISHEMAMDACDMAYEGQPVYEDVQVQCAYCEATGKMTKEDAEKYASPSKPTTLDDELPF